ncbi:phosphotransferase [Microlunatus sp. GCM10028923]|uniref:phosphotransferase n=1 Tax=Microlunatus sp. GCM10028923 TaxID=3273400 RepID=UPI0036109033
MSGAPDETLVRGLLREQHGDLADLELAFAAAGGDHQLWRLGPELVVRLPHHDDAAEQDVNELAWLPAIAARMPVSIPVPVRAGQASALFPRTWMITTWVTGTPADVAPLSAVEAADQLAAALKALHVAAPAKAPATQRPTLDRLAARFEQNLDYADEADVTALRDHWRTAVAAEESSGPPVWIHGDLHPSNVLTNDGELVGMIDFGLLSAGDPAVDLGAAWALLPAALMPRFFERYGTPDTATIRRAAGWAAYIGLSLIAMGQPRHRGEPWHRSAFLDIGRRTVRALSDHPVSRS